MLEVLSHRSTGTISRRNFQLESKLLDIRNRLLGVDDYHDKIYILHCIPNVNLKYKIEHILKRDLPNAKTSSSLFFFDRLPDETNILLEETQEFQEILDAEFLIIDTVTDYNLVSIGKDALCNIAYGEASEKMKPKKIVFISEHDHSVELEFIKNNETAFFARIRDFKFNI